ncbi:AT hook motif DNA-binding family protein [Actinidia rufa]|uniref:AT-hook motif nuclear-localized protein n=1 Tax=Actinidia rufa TaxID=165716 RepID=A0A7J0GFD0_9ERIC|nr:AT hook motif DNA-binding family protein [Actinidia rufa]
MGREEALKGWLGFMLKAVSTMDSYGDVNDGVVQDNNGGNNNSRDQLLGGLIPDMHLAFTTEDGAAVYKPVMPPNSPLAAASGSGGDGSALPKRQRGRPKKYPYEGDMSSLPPQPLEASVAYRASGLASPPPTTTKKSRGRPVGSGLNQQPPAIMGSPRGELTTHIITVTAGEDVSSKIMSFSENGSRGVWILSANGAISNVTLRKPATSEETATYAGHFEILSLSGSYMLLEDGGQRSRTCGLSVTLAGPDGCVLGGGVAGILTAAAPVQWRNSESFQGKQGDVAGKEDWRAILIGGYCLDRGLLSDMDLVVLASRMDKGSNSCTMAHKASTGIPGGSEWYRSKIRYFEICAEVWPDTSGATNAGCLERSSEEGDKVDFEELYSDRILCTRDERWIHNNSQSDVLCDALRWSGGHLGEKLRALQCGGVHTLRWKVEYPVDKGKVVVGCFVAGEVELNSPIQADPLATPPQLLPGASSGGTLSESSGGPGSPIDQSPGACNNTTHKR